MDFWQTVAGNNLSSILQSTLPSLCDTMSELVEEVKELRKENKILSERLDAVNEKLEMQLAEEYGYRFDKTEEEIEK